MMLRGLTFLLILTSGLAYAAAPASPDPASPDSASPDWPQWRQNSGRTAETSQQLGDLTDWKPIWSRELPQPASAFQDVRLQFDSGYEPIVLGKRLVLSSNIDDSVTAYDTGTGAELWKFFTNGPVRFAPVGGKGRILFGSDDGWFYCVKASSGELVWKFKAVPSERKLLGNRHLISVWPIRGGAVLRDDRVYFAAGVWPFEGVFVYCLDATSGKVIWLNDRMGHIYDQQPHNTEALAGLAPQGYLLIDPETDELIVPSSNAYPARLNLKTGAVIEFKLPTPGRLPGGWFASTPGAKEQQKLKRRGLLADDSVNAKRHEDKPRAEGIAGVRDSIHFADASLTISENLPALPDDAEVHGIVAGDGRLFVTTKSGVIHALSKQINEEAPPKRWPLSSAKNAESQFASNLLNAITAPHGFAITLGEWRFEDLAGILEKSKLDRLFAITEKPEFHRDRLRVRPNLQSRFHVLDHDPGNCPLPPYLAGLILVSDSMELSQEKIESLYESVRPYGGRMLLPAKYDEAAKQATLSRATIEPFSDEFILITRQGALEGSSNYTGNFELSPDALVKAPLGVLWFDDEVGNFKRSPQPTFVDGTMISIDKDWLDASTRTGKVDYRLLAPRFTDVYTGRELSKEEVPELRQSFAEIDRETIQPSQYRPANLNERPTPDEPLTSERINPLTGETEPRIFPMAYGCDNGIDYGNLYTMRSATAAFYDKTNESGTINLSGPRSGCTNSIIPANGLLNVPYFYEGCTCSYPLPTGMSLYSLPESHEQWTAWGEMTSEQLAGKIQRIGINFGAPGDRVTRDGLLWIDHPHSGGPSPQVEITTLPEAPDYTYRHSVFMKSGDGHPWVAASGVNRVKSVTIQGLKAGTYRAVLTFCSTSETGEDRTFRVSVQGTELPAPVTLPKPFHSLTRSLDRIVIDGSCTVSLESVDGATQLSGFQLERTGP